MLKHDWSVCEPKRHDLLLEVTDRGLEGSLPLVTAADPDEMISIAKVELGKDLCPLELGKGTIKQQEQVFVTGCDIVEAAVVDAVVFQTKKNPAPTGEHDGTISPEASNLLI